MRDADLVIACTSRDEANLVAATFARIEAPRATTVIRTSNVEYIELWREGQLDVDFVVSSEIETAHAITRVIGVPRGRADRRLRRRAGADRRVRRHRAARIPSVLGKPLRDCGLVPADSRVVSIIRGDSMTMPRGDDVILPATGSSSSAHREARTAWGELLAPGEGEVEDVVIFGGGKVGVAIARQLLEQGIGVRLIEPNRDRARAVAEELPEGARLQRLRPRSGLPRARAHRARAGGRVRDARGREEPLRGDARPHPRRDVHDRDRPRPDRPARSTSTRESTCTVESRAR